MLEDCAELSHCEKMLTGAIEHVRLLGEIPLTDKDIEKLAGMVRNTITPNITKGTRILKTKYPVSFACFLVGMGRFYDKDKGFWPIVEENVEAIDTNWRVKWGKIFKKVLEQHDLPQFDEEDGLAYVTPILGHVCIPDRCLDEYFDQVLVPLVNRELLDPLDREEISHDLRTRRTINDHRLKLEGKKKKQTEKLEALRDAKEELTSLLSAYASIASLLADEVECEKRRIALQGLEDAESTRINYIDQIESEAEVVRRLETDGRRIWRELNTFQKRYQPILDQKDTIDKIIQTHQELAVRILEAKTQEETLFAQIDAQWTAISIQPWEDQYGALIVELEIDQIQAQIEQIQILEEQQKKIQERIKILRASQKTVRKPPLPLLVPFILIWRLFFGTGRKTKRPLSGELQDLHAALEKIKADLQQTRAAIQAEISRLPIDPQQLKTLKISLHQQIAAIRQAYIQALKARESSHKLEQEAEELLRTAQELACSLGMVDQGASGSWPDRLAAALTEAVQRQEQAHLAHQILQEEIRPALEAARAEVQRLQEELTILDERLANIGDGSVDQGLSFVREFHQFQETTAQTWKELINKYLNFPSLEHELRREGFETIQARLEEAAAKNENQVNEVNNDLERIEQALSRYPAQYFGIDEPIRRFLLYGGATSERILRSSVFLFARARAGEPIEDVSEPELPERLIKRFQEWWENYEARAGRGSKPIEETNPATGERYRAPQIAFDLAAGEVIAVLPTQLILRPEESTTVGLEIYADDPNNLIDSVRLKLYSRSNTLVETQPYEAFVLPAPSEKYIFRLTHKNQSIHEWEIPGVSALAPFLAFSAETKKRIKGDALPQARVILVINEKQAIHPDNCILTTGDHLYGGWSEFLWYELDLTTSKELHLIDENGQRSSISLTSDPGATINLVGGQQALNAVSNEQVVYTAPPEYIRIPIADQSDLHLLRFSLLSEDDNRFRSSKHYQLSDLTGFFDPSDEDWLEIPLNHDQFLGENPFGRFTLRVYKPHYLDWQTSFCVVPGLGLSFDQKVYQPYRESIPNVRASLTIPEKSVFQPDQPAVVLSKHETTYQVQTPATEDYITGVLKKSYTGKGNITLTLTLIVPKIRWRLQSLDGNEYDQWRERVEEELWLGDWLELQELFLLVEFPDISVRKAALVLLENSVTIPGSRLFDQTVRFDLKALEDKLRAGPPLETVGISLQSNSISFPNIPFFTVRTRWLAERIKCFYNRKDDIAQVDVSWKERGLAKQKAVSLWYLSDGPPKLNERQIVSAEVQETTFRSPAKEMRSGKYLVHLEPYDPWSSRAICPNPTDENTAIIEITTEPSEKAVTLQTVVVDPTHRYTLGKDSYRIRIIGKVTNQRLPDKADRAKIGHVVITPTNENWYVGNLEVTGIPQVIDYLSDTNPVKFEYDSEKRIITSIEDRYGDGAVYCYKCRMLFWHQGTVEEEKRKKHTNYGPIEEFIVNWETD